MILFIISEGILFKSSNASSNDLPNFNSSAFLNSFDNSESTLKHVTSKNSLITSRF